MCTWLCNPSSNSSPEKYTWDGLSLKSLRGNLVQPPFCSNGETEVQRGTGHSIPTGPDSETPSKLEVETSKELVAAGKETGLGWELGWSPTVLRDP